MSFLYGVLATLGVLVLAVAYYAGRWWLKNRNIK